MISYIEPDSIKRIEKSKQKIVHIIIVATKPDIVKQGPLYQELKKRGELVVVCHTGQHYDFRYSGGVEKEFGIQVDFRLGIEGGLNDKYSQMIDRFGEVLDFLLEKGKTPIPYIHGDTSTAMAIGLGSILKRVACVHVEAGIRTLTPKASVYRKFYKKYKEGRFNWNEYYQAMQKRFNYELGSLEPYPEQINTRMAEAATGFHAAPVELDKKFLLSEGYSASKIAVVGNSVADAVLKSKKEAKKSKFFEEFPALKNGKFIPIFIHRRETCEDKIRFGYMMEAIIELVESGESVMLVSLFAFEAALDRYDYRKEVDRLVDEYPDTFIYTQAITYHADMVALMMKSPVVVVDSGSMQEELNVLGVPCVTLRFGSDRGESFLAGSNVPAPPIDSGFIVEIIKGAKNNKKMSAVKNIYGTNVSRKIVDEVLKRVDPQSGLFITEEQRLGLNLEPKLIDTIKTIVKVKPAYYHRNKIVIDARIINSTTGRYVEKLLHYLQKIDSKNEYVVLIPSKDENYWKPTAKNFSVVFCDIKNYSIKEQTKFNLFLESLKPDLVHFCMPQQPILYKGRTVTTFHDLTLLKTYNDDKNWFKYKTKQQLGKSVFKKAAKNSTQIIVPSEYTKNDLVDFAKIPKSKITVTYEAADIKDTKPAKVTLPFKKFILYVGKQSSYKNIRRLAEAHQKLLKKHPDLGLVLVNQKDKAVLKNESLFKKLGYKNIHFTGRLNDSRLAWLYKNCEAYVFPSLFEGFGLPGLEAMGFQTPIVSSNATCLPEIYGKAAVYFDPLDADDMFNKINKVLTDTKLRSKLATQSKKQFSKYSWEKMAKETLEVYDKALKN